MTQQPIQPATSTVHLVVPHALRARVEAVRDEKIYLNTLTATLLFLIEEGLNAQEAPASSR